MAGAADANLVTGFEVNNPTVDDRDPPHTGEAPFSTLTPLPVGAIPGVPDVARVYSNDLDGDPATFDGVSIPVPGTTNVMHTVGGAFAFAGLPDFYADGFYEWFTPGALYFDEAASGLTFSFWALNNDANGGEDSLVWAMALDENLDPFGELYYPGVITFDDTLIGPEGFVTIAPEGGLYSVGFFFAEGEVFEPPGEGYGIDAVQIIPEPATALLMGLGLVALGARRRQS